MNVEKVVLTPDGLLFERSDEKKLIGDNDPTIIKYLRTYCEIDSDTTLYDVVNFVRRNKFLCIHMSLYSWCNDIDHYHSEIDNKAVIDENGIDHLEIRWTATCDEHKEGSFFTFDKEFVGIGRGEKDKNQENYHLETYCVDLCPLNEIAHLKVVLNTNVDIYKNNYVTVTDQVLLAKSKTCFSLLDVLDAIYWNISFYGSPTKRDEFLEKIDDRMQEGFDIKDFCPEEDSDSEEWNVEEED